MKNNIQNFTEFEFTAKDLDSLETITDVLLINNKAKMPIEDILKSHIPNHPIMSLSGNTWEIEGYQPTGKRIEKQVTYTVTSQRLDEFDKAYPIVDGL